MSSLVAMERSVVDIRHMFFFDANELGVDLRHANVQYINTYRDPAEIVISSFYYLRDRFKVFTTFGNFVRTLATLTTLESSLSAVP